MSLAPKTKRLEKVKALWFDDADVVFQAGQKLFRVHRGILSARSSVFRDMFSIPQAPAVSESTFDGCTLIHLPDGEGDVQNFFLALFDSSYFEPPPSIPVFRVIAGILRLSHKYDVEFLKRRAMSHLNEIFPPNMESSFLQSNLGRETSTVLFQLIEPAYTANMRWIIPVVFLWTVQVRLGAILESECWSELPTPIQHVYLTFREKYHRNREKVAMWIISMPPEECEYRPRCLKAARSYMINYRKFILDSETKLLTRKKLQSLFCPQCTSYIVAQSTLALEKRWNDLPITLGLPNWTTLLKEQAEFDNHTNPT